MSNIHSLLRIFTFFVSPQQQPMILVEGYYKRIASWPTRTSAVTLIGSPTLSMTRRTTSVLLSLTTKSVFPWNCSLADSDAVTGTDRARINPASRKAGSIPANTRRKILGGKMQNDGQNMCSGRNKNNANTFWWCLHVKKATEYNFG